MRIPKWLSLRIGGSIERPKGKSCRHGVAQADICPDCVDEFSANFHLSVDAGVGHKNDGEKPLLRKGAIEMFPRALMAVAKLSEFGAKKYSWQNWRIVPGAIERYGEAASRHQAYVGVEGEYDAESGYLHAAHEAWNTLARLELILQSKSLHRGR